jgi:hypothetical protein
MLKIRQLPWIVLIACLISPKTAIAQSCGLESQLQSLVPARILDLDKELKDAEGNPPPINIVCLRADFDGSGQFAFIVAGYGVPVASTIRIFREAGGQLQVVADLAPEFDGSSSQMDMRLADINNDGKTEIIVKSYGQNTDYGFDVIALDGNTLQILSPDGNTLNAELFDLDGDGKLEIVTPPDTFGGSSADYPRQAQGVYQVFKFNGTKYVLAFTSPNDPTHVLSSTRANSAVFGISLVKPAHFSLKQIREAVEKREVDEGEIMIRIGNLRAPVDDNPGPRSVNDLNVKSITLGRNLRPLKTEVIQGDADDRDDKEATANQTDNQETHATKLEGPFVEAHFSRESLLQFLPHAQLTKPLAAGDVVTLEIRGKMKSGAPLFSSVTVKIAGEDDGKHDGKH